MTITIIRLYYKHSNSRNTNSDCKKPNSVNHCVCDQINSNCDRVKFADSNSNLTWLRLR